MIHLNVADAQYTVPPQSAAFFCPSVQTSSSLPLPWLRSGRRTTKRVRNQAHSSKCWEIGQGQGRCPISHTQHSVTHTLWWRSATWEAHLHIACTKQPSVHNYSTPVFFFFLRRHIYGDGQKKRLCHHHTVMVFMEYWSYNICIFEPSFLRWHFFSGIQSILRYLIVT